MEEVVSVIIPVYNVEDYLKASLESIVNQSYQNLEILLIDDGSTDASGKICDEYAKKDARIQVIHQQNAGAGAAKNTGLDLFTGEYVVLADSDDILPLDSIEQRLRILKVHQADIVQGTFLMFEKNLPEENSQEEEKNSEMSQKAFLETYLKNWENALFWNKIFKASLVKDVRFPIGRCIDDEFFTYKVFFRAEKVVKTNRLLYYYRQRSGSAMTNPLHAKKKLFDQMDFIYDRYFDIKKEYPELAKCYLENLVENYIRFYNSQEFEEVHRKHMKEKLSVLIKDIRKCSMPVTLKWKLMQIFRFKLG